MNRLLSIVLLIIGVTLIVSYSPPWSQKTGRVFFCAHHDTGIESVPGIPRLDQGHREQRGDHNFPAFIDEKPGACEILGGSPWGSIVVVTQPLT